METRKEIPWFKWKYFISDYGRVKNKKQIIMKFETNKQWYHRIKLYKQWKFEVRHYWIHRLVYCVFNNIPIEFTWENLVLHKDDNPQNNKLDNLFLWTYKDNMSDCSLKGRVRVPALKWELNPLSKLTDSKVIQIKQLLKQWVKQNFIAKEFGVSKATINSIKQWKIWTHVLLP